jgi:hypothetical protein
MRLVLCFALLLACATCASGSPVDALFVIGVKTTDSLPTWPIDYNQKSIQKCANFCIASGSSVKMQIRGEKCACQHGQPDPDPSQDFTGALTSALNCESYASATDVGCGGFTGTYIYQMYTISCPSGSTPSSSGGCDSSPVVSQPAPATSTAAVITPSGSCFSRLQ